MGTDKSGGYMLAGELIREYAYIKPLLMFQDIIIPVQMIGENRKHIKHYENQ